MRKVLPLPALAALLLASTAPAAVTPNEVIEAAPAGDWREVPAEDLLLLDFANGSRVAIELAPAFAPVHVENIRKLARAGWWQQSAAIVRVQDNYVVQWGDPTAKAPLSPGVVAQPPAEYERPVAGLGKIRPLGSPDPYASAVGHLDGWAVGSDPATGTAWLAHCNGMVGVGRENAPDVGTGAELYAVIGHGPRQLDRNIALVGRVVDGLDRMSSLPRGTGEIGFYEKAGERIAITRATIASDLPVAERPHYQVMRTDSASFTRLVHTRANRQDDFYIRPAGGIDLCNAAVPTRKAAK